MKASDTQLASTVPTLATGVLALVLYSVAASAAGWRATLHRDAV
jgi:hypothetical protein